MRRLALLRLHESADPRAHGYPCADRRTDTDTDAHTDTHPIADAIAKDHGRMVHGTL